MKRDLNPRHALAADPQWYKDAVIYELRVRSYMDSNGDGVGDFQGLSQKLDYLEDLGVTAIWLLPFYPSPGRDDGYDISDYTDVHPDMGTLEDFKQFLNEAHRRHIRVITELVLNHTSDAHPWFQRARRAPRGSSERDFYVWSDTPEPYKEARIIFKDFETSNWTWDPVAKQYFWHRFFSHQPDLNFENPDVQQALFGAVDFWFGLGVDGLRLDAVPYLYEQDGTSCENLPQTHQFLKKLRAHVDAHFPARMLLAEANQWPEDAARYFGNGDECHMNFHFPIMPRLFMAIHMEDRLPIIDILAQTPTVHPSCQWALFLRNHDELTLEMVTDEERDYMYRAFAKEQPMRINLGIRRRLAPLLGNNRRNIELVNALLCSLPGTPVLYYGDEIGMGDNVYLGDRNGVRTPMQWSSDRNAGFSRANPQKLILPVIIDPEYHFESLNVEAQQNNPNSLLWWTKRLLALRSKYQAFGRGTIDFLSPENPKVLAFIRQYEGETLLVVANLSRSVQYVELDLGKFQGTVPTELLGRTRFPPIGALPYLLTLGGYGFYWFKLNRPRTSEIERLEAAYAPPTLEVAADPETLFAPEGRSMLEEALPAWLEGRRWYAGRDRAASAVHLRDVLRLQQGDCPIFMVIAEVEYPLGEPETYVLPLAIVRGPRSEEIRVRSAHALVASLKGPAGETSVLVDAVAETSLCAALIDLVGRGVKARGASGELTGSLHQPLPENLEVRPLKGDHGSAAVIIGEKLLLKFYRRMNEGTSPELEMLRFLGQHSKVPLVPPVAGALELRRGRAEPITLAVLEGYVANEGTAWSFSQAELGRFYEHLLTRARGEKPPPLPERAFTRLADLAPTPEANALMASWLLAIRLLGQRTAELHLALASSDDPAFAPEPYSVFDQRSTYQSMRNLTGKVLRELRVRLPGLDEQAAALGRQLLDRESVLYKRFEPLLERRLSAARGRRHGDLHLAQVLFTGKDFVFIDFEGDRLRPLSERRRKRAPLRDLARMIRSFHLAAHTALANEAVVRIPDRPMVEPWAQFWFAWTTSAYLRSYLDHSGGSPFLPKDRREVETLLQAFVLEKTLQELGAELVGQSSKVRLALDAVLQLVDVER